MTFQQLRIDSIRISLSVPADQKGQYEIIDINGIEGQNPSIPIAGLPGISHLQISSWILQSELDSVRSQNPHIHFCTGAV